MSVRGGNPPQPLYAVGPDGKLKPLVCTEDGNLAVFSAGASAEAAAAEPRSKSIRSKASTKLQAVQQVWPVGTSGAELRCTCLVEAQCSVLEGAMIVHSLSLRNNLDGEVVVKIYDCVLQETESPSAAKRKSLRKKKPQLDTDSLDEDPFERCLPASSGDSEHGVFSWSLAAGEKADFAFPAGWAIKHGIVARCSGNDTQAINGNGLLLVSYSR